MKSRIQLKKSRIQFPLSTNPVPGIRKSRIRIELSYMGRGDIRNTDAAFLSDGRQPEVDFLHHWTVVWLKLSGKSSLREKKLSNTILLASTHRKREKGSLPVDVRRSKVSLLKLPVSEH